MLTRSSTALRLCWHFGKCSAARFFLCVLCFGMATGAQAVDRTNSTRVLSVGVLQENYPFSFSEFGGTPVGFAVDLLGAIERTMGLRLNRITGKTAEINSAFVNGQLDLLQS